MMILAEHAIQTATTSQSLVGLIERVGIPAAMLGAILWWLFNSKNGILTKAVNGHLELVAKLSDGLDQQSIATRLIVDELRPLKKDTHELTEMHKDSSGAFSTQRTNSAVRSLGHLVLESAVQLGVDSDKLTPHMIEIERVLNSFENPSIQTA